MSNITTLIFDFEKVLLSQDQAKARDILLKSASPHDPIRSIEQLIVPAMEKIGRGWESGEVALSQIYMSSRICEELIDEIMTSSDLVRRKNPRLAIAVLHDYHLLGKRIVYSVLRAGGWDVLDYGQIEAETLVKKAKKDHIDILFISTLMLPSALRVKDVRLGLSRDVKIIVGGAPFRLDETLWKEVGADAMGYHASDVLSILSGQLK